MSWVATFRPEAQIDVLEARDWYERQQQGLGDSFKDSLDHIIVRVETMPQMYAVVFSNVRRGKLRRFPYVIYYRILSDRIEVIAVLHGSRDPRLWQERVS